jgi:Tfp pilus assembly protein PilV
MFNIISNNKGITMVETVIAVCLTAIAIVALMPMQDRAINVISRSDYMGRAEGIMQAELELQENVMMNSDDITSPITPGTFTKTVYASSNGTTSGISGSGDASFTVVTNISVAAGTKSWLVNVKVTWKGNATGITSSMIASRIST